MDKKYLMGSGDGLLRSVSDDATQTTFISPSLRTNLIILAIKKAYNFYSDFFDKPILNLDYHNLVNEYEQAFSNAHSLGLFLKGGIDEKDHLNLWCLSHVLSPEIYVESGVFIGSSLHAFIQSSTIKKVIAIDPDLSKLKIAKNNIPDIELIDDKDFSQIDIDLIKKEAIVYFDDHINTADRIIQASKKGFRYVLFDDSTGLEGVCQRLYPAIPTIPMIMNVEIFNSNDMLSWTFYRPNQTDGIRVSLTITQEFIDKCTKAKKLIKKYNKIPDLGEFIPQSHPRQMVDISKYLIELNQN